MEKLKEEILEQFSVFESALNGSKSEVLHQLRLSAMDQITTFGFPQKKTEDWKFTPITKNLEKVISEINSKAKNSSETKNEVSFNNDSAIEIFNINGHWHFENVKSHGEDILIDSFENSFENEVFKKYFNKIASKENTAFSSLNTAFVNDGLFIHLAKNRRIEKEIVVHFINDSSSMSILTQPRILAICDENSSFTLVENHLQKGAAEIFSNNCTEIHVAQSANVGYYKLMLDASLKYHTGLTSVDQFKNSVFTAYNFSFGGAMIRHDLDIHLLDEHIESHMYGAYLLDGNSHVDNHTSVNHAFPNCESNELYKGILNDKSTAVFNGKIFVRKDAQKTNAFQSNRNLILSPDATVHTKPQLEIWADDVKCSHGATIGQLDEEQLFYLRSRGISKKDAITLLTHAFIGEVVEKIEVDYIKERVEKALTNKSILHYD